MLLILMSIAICAFLAAMACAGMQRPMTIRAVVSGFIWRQENTGAFFAFVVIAFQTLMVMLTSCGMLHVSKHIVISLDILYSISLILLSLYHLFKDSFRTSCKTA